MKKLRKVIWTLLVFGLLTSSPNRGLSQTQKIDSLKSLLSGKTGAGHAEILFEIAWEYMDFNNELGYEYAKRAFEMAQTTDDSLIIVKTGRMTSQALRRLGKIDSAIVLFDKVLPIARRHNFSSETKRILNGLGVAYLRLAKYDKALVYFFELLQQKDIDDDKLWKSTVLNNIGLVYGELEDCQTALGYHYQSLDLKNKLGDEAGQDLSYINISLCLAFNGDYVNARELTNKVFSSCGTKCSEDILQSLFNNLGIIDFGERNYAEAERNFLKSYELNKKMKETGLALSNLGYLVKINTQLNKPQVAEHYLNDISTLISEGAPYNYQMIFAYLELISMYEKLNNFKKIAYYQKKYITLKDSVFDQQLTTNLMKIEADHLEEKNKARIESQNKILALNEEIILRQKYLSIVIAIVALLLVALAIVLIRNIKQKQKANHLLDKRVQERTKELELNRDVLQRACEERDILLDKTSIDIRTFLITIKGLCSTGLKDLDDPLARQYLDGMNTAADSFSVILRRLRLTKNGVTGI